MLRILPQTNKSIEKTKNVITIEDGTIINGLGTAIKELIIDSNLKDVNVKTYAYPDKFIEHGSVDQLEEIYGLDENTIFNETKLNIDNIIKQKEEREQEQEKEKEEQKHNEKKEKTANG